MSPAPLAEGGWTAFWGLLFSVRKMPFSSLFSLSNPGHLRLRERQPERHVVAMTTEHLNKTWYPKKAREAGDQTRKGSTSKRKWAGRMGAEDSREVSPPTLWAEERG